MKVYKLFEHISVPRFVEHPEIRIVFDIAEI